MTADPAKEDGRRLRHRHRRPELLRGAADYVLERGLADLSLRPLAAHLGVTHRGLLHHFGTKERLLVEIARELRHRERERLVAEAGRTPCGAGELLREVWQRVSADEHLCLVRFHLEVQRLAAANPEEFAGYGPTVAREWVETISGILADSPVPLARREAAATFVYAAIRGLQLDLLATGDRQRVDAGFEELLAATRLLREAGAEAVAGLAGDRVAG